MQYHYSCYRLGAGRAWPAGAPEPSHPNPPVSLSLSPSRPLTPPLSRPLAQKCLTGNIWFHPRPFSSLPRPPSPPLRNQTALLGDRRDGLRYQQCRIGRGFRFVWLSSGREGHSFCLAILRRPPTTDRRPMRWQSLANPDHPVLELLLRTPLSSLLPSFPSACNYTAFITRLLSLPAVACPSGICL